MMARTLTVCKFCGMEIEKEKDIYRHIAAKHDHELHLLIIQIYGDNEDYESYGAVTE